MRENDARALSLCPLFAGCDPKEVHRLLEVCGAREETFPPHSPIPFREKGVCRMGIVLRGSACAYSKDQKTPLNRLGAGCLFGVSSLYSQSDAETEVLANGTQVSVLFVKEEKLSLLLEHPVICRNFIAFLTGRIRFLTEKIASFTAPSAEKKLARYLAKKQSENGCLPPFASYSGLARTLNLGRASLYRAMEILIENGVIEKEGKSIRILSQKKLKLFL